MGTTGEGILAPAVGAQARRPSSSSKPAADGLPSPSTAARRRPRTPSRSPPTRPKRALMPSPSSPRPTSRSTKRLLEAHFEAAAAACAPTPFYVYEFAKASGYAVPVAVVERLREPAPQPGRHEGLRRAVGALRALPGRRARRLRRARAPDRRGHGAGRARRRFGARHGLPGAGRGRRSRPRAPRGASGLAELRDALDELPRHAALKRVLARRGVPIREDVRAPLRGLSGEERARLDELAEAWLG